jgi:protocatechuate 4,5-dioxygenase, alpha chain
METVRERETIPGTIFFDGKMAMKGYSLNKMCYSLNEEQNRKTFFADEEAYYDRYGLTEEQKSAVRRRHVLDMLQAGGNIYYLAKLAIALGLSVQDVGAQQTGVSVEEFKAKLVAAGH